MNKIKKMILFLTLSIILQTSIYFMLNWQADQLMNPSFQFGKSYDLPVSLEYTQEHQLSFNNHYLAYLSDNADNAELKGNHILNVIDLTKNQRVYISRHKINSSVLGYEWLPDRNSLVYLVKGNTEGQTGIQLYTLDLDIASLETIESKYNRDIPYPANKVIDVGISTYTNNLYFLMANEAGKASQANSKGQLIKMDIMKTINMMNLQGEEIQRIAVSNKFGTTYLESVRNSTKSISASPAMERVVISQDPDHILIGCYNDKLFLGKRVQNELKEILLYHDPNSGAPPAPVSLWKGSLSYTDLTHSLCLDNKVIIQNPEQIDVISQNGTHDGMRITGTAINIISPTGKMLMEINASRNKTSYTWQAIE